MTAEREGPGQNNAVIFVSVLGDIIQFLYYLREKYVQQTRLDANFRRTLLSDPRSS